MSEKRSGPPAVELDTLALDLSNLAINIFYAKKHNIAYPGSLKEHRAYLCIAECCRIIVKIYPDEISWEDTFEMFGPLQ